MLSLKIWEKYFLKEILKTFFLFLICFYGLYILIDYTNQGRDFHKEGSSFWFILFLYYACEFVVRSEVLIPFAILLGTIRTLCKLNDQNELIAMMASGIKASRLLRPFLFLGIFFTFLMYLNLEFILPLTGKEMQNLENNQGKKKKLKTPPMNVEHMILEDDSTLLFQKYDSLAHSFFDVFWIKSIDEIYKMKYLEFKNLQAIGHFVDRILRNESNQLEIVESYDNLFLPDLAFDSKKIEETLLQPENLSLSELWKQLPSDHKAESEKEARLISTFHRKLALPWLCLLAILAPAPFCLKFSRQFPVFLVYASSLFGLIGIYIVIDAAHVLGRRQFLDPVYALWTPFLVFFLIFGWRYIRLK